MDRAKAGSATSAAAPAGAVVRPESKARIGSRGVASPAGAAPALIEPKGSRLISTASASSNGTLTSHLVAARIISRAHGTRVQTAQWLMRAAVKWKAGFPSDEAEALEISREIWGHDRPGAKPYGRRAQGGKADGSCEMVRQRNI